MQFLYEKFTKRLYENKMFNKSKRNIEKDLNKIKVKFLKVYEDYRINEIFIIWLRNSKTKFRYK